MWMYVNRTVITATYALACVLVRVSAYPYTPMSLEWTEFEYR